MWKVLLSAALIVLPNFAFADDQTVLEEFKVKAEQFSKFFAKEQQLIYGQHYSDSRTGKLFTVESYSGSGVSFDVQKTSSLVSPYTAYIHVDLASKTNETFGNVRFVSSGTPCGWDNAESAMKFTKPQHFTIPSYMIVDGKQTTDPVRFNFAYQDKKWVLVSVIREEFHRPELAISNTLRLRAEPGIVIDDEHCQEFNKKWLDLLLPKSESEVPPPMTPSEPKPSQPMK